MHVPYFSPQNGPEDLLLSAYRFELPPERIAQSPPERREASRLMVLDRKKGTIHEASFTDLPTFLPPSLIVVNNSRVVPARLTGKRPSGGKVDFLLTTPLPHIVPENRPPEQCGGEEGHKEATVSCLVKGAKRLRPGEEVVLGTGIAATILERGEYGQCRARLTWQGDLTERLLAEGQMPLPPYIRRPQTPEDAERYQTVYAHHDKAGSIAAPTAGLHFTPEIRDALCQAGFLWAEVTLFVGYGTFSPVRHEDIRNHAMHREYCEISPETAAMVAEAGRRGMAVTAVGTTAARTLEGVALARGRVEAFRGWTDIFLYPGKPLRVVDHLLTNFHLPESTLLMLIATFAGRKTILDAYARAIASGFRFFSYGDAMLII